MPLERTRRGKRRALKRLLLRPWVILPLFIAVLTSGYLLFIGWRARDLAAKAWENFERGNYRMAWLQANSAREMRPADPEVLRTVAALESRFGRPEALATLQQIERKGLLSEEETEQKVKAAMRFGTEEEFEAAVQKLEAMRGGTTLRAARAAMRGDIDRAVKEARKTAEATGHPEAKLELANLLSKRHGHVLRSFGRPAAEDVPALQEAAQLIDSLQDTDLAEPAWALGLGTATADEATKKRWAAAGVKNLSPANPALLPAAEFLIRIGEVDATDMRTRLRPVYDRANLAQRADFALWLSRQNLPKEALTLMTAQEAADDISAFLARTDALGRLSNWPGVLEAAEAAKKVPGSMRQLTRVWATLNLDDGMAKKQALRPAVEAAVQSAAQENQLRSMLLSLDSIGVDAMATEQLVRLCANPLTADAAFSLLRERIGRTRGTGALETAYQSAKGAAPNAPSVMDHWRYLELFGALRLTFEDTMAAIAVQPSEVAPRITHALFMLRKNDPVAAKATFDDVTVFFDQMIPAQQAVVAAYTAGTGDLALARMMRETIRTNVLTAGEVAVLDRWVPAGGGEEAR
jgi:hypothetical protein